MKTKKWGLLGFIVPMCAFAFMGIFAIASSTSVHARAANGKIAYQVYIGGGSQIFTMNQDGSGKTQLTNSTGYNSAPSFSPDGSKVVFYTNRDGNNEIYIMNADGSNQMRLTNNPASEEVPSFSPDGTKITFTTTRDGNYEGYIMNLDGTNPVNLTNNPSGADYIDSWSPNGTKMSIETNRDGNWEVYTMNPDGSGQTNITNNPAADYYSAWSPDGSKLAFYTNRDGTGGGDGEIYTMNPDGTNLVNLTNTPATYEYGNSWSPDGTRITYTSWDPISGDFDIHSMKSDGSDQIPLTNDGLSEMFSSQAWQKVMIGDTVTKDDRLVTTISAAQDYSTFDLTLLSNETLILDGKICDLIVPAGAVLMGSGGSMCSLNINPGGKIAPGHSPGCLTSGNTVINGSFDVEIGGTTPCSGHDQLIVNGTLDISGASLNLLEYGGFVPAVGNSFVIVNKTGAGAITGMFSGLPEGSTVSVNGIVFRISYIGGDGNDITLTTLLVPTAPNTGLGVTIANPTLIAAVTIFSSVIILLITLRLKSLYSK